MTTRLTDEEIRDALVLCEQATPGPWVSGKMFGASCVNLSRETKGRSVKTGMCSYCVPGYSWDTTPIREFEIGKTLWHLHQKDAYDGHHSIYSSGECAQVAGNYDNEDGGIVNQSDSEFIAARDILPRALAELKELREELAYLHAGN